MFVFYYLFVLLVVFFTSRRRHTRCALVTVVQTCATPIWGSRVQPLLPAPDFSSIYALFHCVHLEVGSLSVYSFSLGLQFIGLSGERARRLKLDIGRASCRERVCQ